MATIRDSNKKIKLSPKNVTKVNLKSKVKEELEYWDNLIKKQK